MHSTARIVCERIARIVRRSKLGYIHLYLHDQTTKEMKEMMAKRRLYQVKQRHKDFLETLLGEETMIEIVTVVVAQL